MGFGVAAYEEEGGEGNDCCGDDASEEGKDTGDCE